MLRLSPFWICGRNDFSDRVKRSDRSHELSFEQWKAISSIKDSYGDVLFTAPLISVNVAHPLLMEIESELENKERLFSFLCGHDSNLGSVLAALGVKDYDLPGAIENKTPIGAKLVFEKWSKDGEEFIRVRMLYNSVDQLRNLSILDESNPPLSYILKFDGLPANEDDMIPLKEFTDHLHRAIVRYDELLEEYGIVPVSLPKTGVE